MQLRNGPKLSECSSTVTCSRDVRKCSILSVVISYWQRVVKADMQLEATLHDGPNRTESNNAWYHGSDDTERYEECRTRSFVTWMRGLLHQRLAELRTGRSMSLCA